MRPSIPRRDRPQLFAQQGHNYYCGWNAMRTLKQYALVDHRCRPALYSLTPAGVAAAQTCMERAGLQADGIAEPSAEPTTSVAAPPASPPGTPLPATASQQATGEQGDGSGVSSNRRGGRGRGRCEREGGGEGIGGRGSPYAEGQQAGSGRVGRGRGRKRQARSAADGGTTVAAAVAAAVASQDAAAAATAAARKRAARAPPAAAGEAAAPLSGSGVAAAAAGEGEAVLGGEASALMASLHGMKGSGCSGDRHSSLASAHPASPQPSLSPSETADIRLPPLAQGQRFCDAYEVVVLIDSREKGAAQLAEFLSNVEKVPAQVTALPVGDALWAAQPLTPTSSSVPTSSSSAPPSCTAPSSSSSSPALPAALFCLEWVVERKRVDDLWASIKGKRFKDQKLRIKVGGGQS
ncbi:hypothetical protein CLOM_g7366 [Closterium sp. NIES-68]|nr:hypothetical protein CLOM_g7366 [Closterium sp. NIES-68]